MRYAIRGHMWYGRLARLLAKLLFGVCVLLAAALVLVLVLIAFFQAIGIVA